MKIDTEKLQITINKILKYNKDRGWNKAESSDFAKSIVIEAAELLEKFQWDESDRKIKIIKKDWNEISSELADILWYIIAFCNKTKIDPIKALEKKIKWNEKKYPKEKFSGKHNDKFYKSRKKEYRKRKIK